MTAIAVAQDDDQIVMGSDGGATMGEVMTWNHGSKLAYIEGAIVGMGGSYRIGQVIEGVLRDKPDLLTCSDTTMADAILDALDDAKGVSDEDGWSLLIAYDGTCRFVASDGSVLPIQDYFAIGTGMEFAMGALHALRGRAPIDEAVRSAIQAAIDHAPDCDGEVHLARMAKSSQ